VSPINEDEGVYCMSGMDALNAWVDDAASLTKPDKIVWLNGSQDEYKGLIAGMLDAGKLTRLNETAYPHSYLYRSAPSDVARTESDTYICTTRKEDAGPTNNWMSPAKAKETVRPLFEGVMRGRTMYVIPYLMGPAGSPLARVGIEITDSPYVAASMFIMTRVGQLALDHLKANGGTFFPGLHSVANLDEDNRYILHFPEENLVWSINSGYGGNALLGKKCLSLRLASWAGRQEGWLAEHMLILGLEDPTGNVTYMAGAFPSACGKTNLAMLVSPLADQGWRVWTVGDDIAWMRIGPDGRLWAVNPEAGFFGVAPGTNTATNPNAMAALSHDSLFTNVALTPDGLPWWEGIDPENDTPPSGTLDWQGHPWARGDGPNPKPAAHPQLALHCAHAAVSIHLAQVGRSPGRADLSFHLWRAARAAGAAGLSVVQLAAWRLRRREHGVGANGGGGRRGRRGAPRPNGDAAVLWL